MSPGTAQVLVVSQPCWDRDKDGQLLQGRSAGWERGDPEVRSGSALCDQDKLTSRGAASSGTGGAWAVPL